jgi:hypothetical protein
MTWAWWWLPGSTFSFILYSNYFVTDLEICPVDTDAVLLRLKMHKEWNSHSPHSSTVVKNVTCVPALYGTLVSEDHTDVTFLLYEQCSHLELELPWATAAVELWGEGMRHILRCIHKKEMKTTIKCNVMEGHCCFKVCLLYLSWYSL